MQPFTMARSVLGATLAAALLAGSAPSLAATKYECHRYVNGKPQGHVNVSAANARAAEKEALNKYRKQLKKKVDYVKCKGAWF